MKKFIILAVMSAVMLSCQISKSKDSNKQSEAFEIIMNREDISQCENIVKDSSYMDSKGDTAWHRINKHTIEIKMGKNCYLLRENADGLIISAKYHYKY